MRRERSALACSSATPGFSRAMPAKLNWPRCVSFRLSLSGTTTEGRWSRNRKLWGSTPMISRGRPSRMIRRPMVARSPPNLVCQYWYDSTTVSGPSGESSFLSNSRPSAGCTPSIGKTPSVTSMPRTSSGSPAPVTLKVSPPHIPTSWKLFASSLYVKYKNAAEPACSMFTPGARWSTLTSCSGS